MENYITKNNTTNEKNGNQRVRGKALKVLEALAMTGLISAVVLLSPQAAPKLLETALRELSHRRRKKVFRDLHQKKMISLVGQAGEKLIKITEAGKRKILVLKLRLLRVRKPTKWDKKFRIVLFDVPEEKRQVRDMLRAKLQNLGFYRLQKSAWVFPWPCKAEIDFIKATFEVAPYVEYIVTDKLDCQKKVKQHYKI